MSYLVMNDYIKLVRNNINEYMKIILDHRYNKAICDEFSEVYISTIYYDSYINEKTMKQKNRLNKNFEIKYNKLISLDSNIEKLKIIETIYAFLDYVIEIEQWYEKDKINELVSKIDELKKENFQKEDMELKERLIAQIKFNIKEKQEFFTKYENKEFYLDKKKIASDLYKINLKHNIKFPMIYSSSAINKVFNTGIINEDKLLVEYMLISIQIIEDIESGNSRQNYLLDFAGSLFDKNQKLTRLLNILENAAIQDRVSVVIDYSLFVEYKESIYELIKLGFNVAIKLDESFNVDVLELKILTLFSHVLVNEKLKCYNELIKHRNIVKNIVKI